MGRDEVERRYQSGDSSGSVMWAPAFAADRKTLDPDGTLLKRYNAEREIRLGDDGSYWA